MFCQSGRHGSFQEGRKIGLHVFVYTTYIFHYFQFITVENLGVLSSIAWTLFLSWAVGFILQMSVEGSFFCSNAFPLPFSTSKFQFSSFARHWLPIYRIHSHPASIFLLASVFNPGDLHYLGYKNNSDRLHDIVVQHLCSALNFKSYRLWEWDIEALVALG